MGELKSALAGGKVDAGSAIDSALGEAKSKLDKLKADLEAANQARRKAVLETKELARQLEEGNKVITVLRQKLQKAGVR